MNAGKTIALALTLGICLPLASCKTAGGRQDSSGVKGLANSFDRYEQIKPVGNNFYKVSFQLQTVSFANGQRGSLFCEQNDWRFFLVDTKKSDISKGIVRYYASWIRKEDCPTIADDLVVQSDSQDLSVGLLAVEKDVFFDDFLSAGSLSLLPDQVAAVRGTTNPNLLQVSRLSNGDLPAGTSSYANLYILRQEGAEPASVNKVTAQKAVAEQHALGADKWFYMSIERSEW